VNVKLSLCSFN